MKILSGALAFLGFVVTAIGAAVFQLEALFTRYIQNFMK